MSRWIFILTLFFSLRSFALTAESQTQVGGFSQSENLALAGSFVDDKDIDSLLRYWNFSAGVQKSKDPTTDNWTTGNDYSAGLGWEHHKRESFNLDVDYSKIPDEGLSTLAWIGEFGIKYNSAKKKTLDGDIDDWFQPTIKPALRGGLAQYSETADQVEKKTNVHEDRKLRQTMLGFSLAYSAVEWMTAKVGYDVYGYGKNVGKFLESLDKNTISSQRWSGLSGSLYDLNLWDADLTLTFYPLDSMDIRYYYKYGIAAADHTQDWEAKLLFTFYVGDHFTIEPGYEHYYSSTLTDNMALLNIAYSF